MKITQRLVGVCSSTLCFELSDDGVVTNVAFTNGCDGNLKAIGKLIDGMKAEHVVKTLLGNTCDGKRTSCTDQLARSIARAANISI